MLVLCDKYHWWHYYELQFFDTKTCVSCVCFCMLLLLLLLLPSSVLSPNCKGWVWEICIYIYFYCILCTWVWTGVFEMLELKVFLMLIIRCHLFEIIFNIDVQPGPFIPPKKRKRVRKSIKILGFLNDC